MRSGRKKGSFVKTYVDSKGRRRNIYPSAGPGGGLDPYAIGKRLRKRQWARKPALRIYPWDEWLKVKAKGTFKQKVELASKYADIFYDWPLGYDNRGMGCPQHQREWIRMAQDFPWLLLIAPSDHGKTTAVSVGYAIWRLANNRDLRVGIFSNAGSQVRGIIREITAHFEENKDLIKGWGEFKPAKPDVWNDSELIIEGRRKFGLLDVSLLGRGVTGELQNRRLDLAILDDPISPDDCLTEYRRETIQVWFNEILGTRLCPDGEVKVQGTFQGYADLYCYILSKKREVFRCFAYRAMAPPSEKLWCDLDREGNKGWFKFDASEKPMARVLAGSEATGTA